jgi:hypothetical protein
VGHERSPTLDDQEELPYICVSARPNVLPCLHPQRARTAAFTSEVFRWRQVAVMGGQPHAPTEDDEYNGWKIPKGAAAALKRYSLIDSRSHRDLDPGQSLVYSPPPARGEPAVSDLSSSDTEDPQFPDPDRFVRRSSCETARAPTETAHVEPGALPERESATVPRSTRLQHLWLWSSDLRRASSLPIRNGPELIRSQGMALAEQVRTHLSSLRA